MNPPEEKYAADSDLFMSPPEHIPTPPPEVEEKVVTPVQVTVSAPDGALEVVVSPGADATPKLDEVRIGDDVDVSVWAGSSDMFLNPPEDLIEAEEAAWVGSSDEFMNPPEELVESAAGDQGAAASATQLAEEPLGEYYFFSKTGMSGSSGCR